MTTISQSKVHRAIVLVFVAIGIMDIVLRCIVCQSFSLGITYAIEDPGKTVFMLFVLPLAVSLFLNRFPISKLKAIFSTLTQARRRVFWIVTFVITAVGLLFTYQHEECALCQRSFKAEVSIMPYDLGEADKMKALILLRDSIFKQVNKYGISKKKEDSLVYAAMVDRYRTISKPMDVEACTFANYGSVYIWWSAFETLLSVFFVAVLLFSIVLISLSQAENKLWIDNLIICVITIVPWIFLRLYSELYINFSHLPAGSATGIIILVVVLIIFLFIAIMARKELRATTNKRITIAYIVASALYALVSAFTPSYVRTPFVFIYGLGLTGTILIIALILLPLILLIFINPEEVNVFGDSLNSNDENNGDHA